MRRRDFISLVGGSAVTWPLATQAQQAAMPVIGFMSGRSRGESTSVVNAFHSGLAETGYSEGRNVFVEYSWADGQYDRLPKMAKDLVDRQVAVIAATGGSVSGLAAKTATAAIPIVFSSGGDAVKLGLVASLNRPGGNVTGVNLIFGALGAKRLELLHAFIASARSMAMLVNLNYPSAANEVQDVQRSAQALGLQVETYNAPTPSDFEKAFATMVERKMAGVLVGDDPFLQSRRDQLIALAARYTLPAIYFSRDFVEDGGLMSYGPSINDERSCGCQHLGSSLCPTTAQARLD
jgi:putative ABC transport system substrate-binding protein